jgi:hypothetical protein
MRHSKLKWVLIFLLAATAPVSAEDLGVPNNSAVCADVTPTAKLACRIHQEAIWSIASHLTRIANQHGAKAAPVGPRPGAVELWISNRVETLAKANLEFYDLRKNYQLQAILSALDAVPVLASSALYSYAASSDLGFKPPENLAQVLETNRGVCGNAAELFQTVLNKLGLETRFVQFWWRDDDGNAVNHIAVEVAWNGGWHLYDPTFGAYFVAKANDEAEALATDAARRVEYVPVVNRNNTNYRNWKLAGLEPFDYLKRPLVDVTIGGKGAIHAYLKPDHEALVSTFENIPNYVGDIRADGNTEGLLFLFLGVSGRFDATVTVAASAGCQFSTPMLNERPFPFTPGVHVIRDVVDPSILQIKGPDDVCYLDLTSVRFDPVSGPG